MTTDTPHTPRAFPLTQWTLLKDVDQSTSDDQRQALAELLNRYLPALRTHLLLERRLSPERVEDLLQGFVSRKVLEQKILRRMEPNRGRFRSFLLRILNNYVTDELRAEKVRAFSAGKGSSDEDDAAAAAAEVADDSTAPPTDVYDAAWAREMISGAVEAMKAECNATGRSDIWDVFQYRVLEPALEGTEPMGYDELVTKLGLRSPAQASNVLITAKRMFARALRSAVGEYVEPGEVEGELAELQVILARGRGSV